MGGVKGAAYEHIRQNSNYNSPVTGMNISKPKMMLVTDLSQLPDLASNDLRCNVGGANNSAGTTTISVAAGSTVSFGLDGMFNRQILVLFSIFLAVATAFKIDSGMG